MKVPAPHKEKQRRTIASFDIQVTESLQVCCLTFSYEPALNDADK
jgi:hypothetical protein